jgi:hypothetical protein
MNFAEAVHALKETKKIRRKSWKKLSHMEYGHDEDGDKRIIFYTLEAIPFNYDWRILLSEDWVIVGENEDEIIDFPTAFQALLHKKNIRLKAWDKSDYIELSSDQTFLFKRTMLYSLYTPTMEDFKATDWEIFDE